MTGSPERIQLRVSGDVLNSRDPRFPRIVAVTAAVENILRRVYAKEHDEGPTPWIRNRVDAWTMQFRRDPDSTFGDYLLTVEMELGERRMPVTVDQMQAEITRLLTTPRGEAEEGGGA